MKTKNKNGPRVGIFGATGAVGKELQKVLHDRKFPLSSIRLFASERSAGKTVETPFGKKTIENANNADYSGIDIAFFAIGGGWPKENAKKATDAGCIVIDNSSTFRYDDTVPLVVPEINAGSIGSSRLIANPNCTTAIAAIPLWVIYKNYGLKKVIISTYQATSGAGAEGMEELVRETRNYLEGKEAGHEVFQYPIAFNLIPHIDKFQDNDYTKEEMKVVWETRKIFGDQKIPLSCTCVRIPTMRVHSESIVVETEKPVDPAELRDILRKTAGVTVKDDITKNIYPMPLTATGKYDVEVGRIRQSLIFGRHGIEFFVCGDQLLRGAASNAVQIAEAMLSRL
ncbi:aspartate-semialdehyde dehydrogenase [Candidatus Woesearchaeota archaeon CG10_big_fil_rev_8_21_14_0_10_44_13]|nr:MAG: aspartate-semialdehyde dehydrogenase [Candidatus Woesearchaeota archaeon CG10_big_fil_rev_8_21_14_0_10_44_13]